jgi:N-acetylmuramoyl-L-alanine amidase
MPSAPGTIGALGTREMDVNFALAKAVESLLLKEKAVPILSRASPEDEVGLPDRPRMAWDRKAEIFVSIHNNNLSGGKNPFSSPHGFSVFYYHPHSLPLARAMYRSYEANVPLPGEELRYGDLLVARMTEMPAVLTETAYLTFPEQEHMLLDGSFRRKVADAIVGGLRDYADGERARQLRAAPPPPSAKPEKPLPPKPRVEKPRPRAPAPRPGRRPTRGRRTARRTVPA